MDAETVKRIEDFSDESDEFDRRLEDIELDEEREQLLDEVSAWLGECAEHGRYYRSASPERRALRNLISMWKVRLRRFGRDDADVLRLADYEADAGVALTVECPYPGLDPYDEDKGAIFFGRQALVDAHVAHLEDDATRILLVIGASGSGKSSLAMAGVLPALKRRHGDDWLFPAPFTPGASPLLALARSLAGALGNADAADGMEQALAANPTAALSVVARHCGEHSPLFIVDQFEELFTVCRSDGERERFAAVLVALSEPEDRSQTCKPRLLLTLRTDYLARLENDGRLQALHARLVGERNHDYVGGLEAPDLRRAIAEPAAAVGLRFPTPLVERLANETAGLPNGLPSLQFALRWLWENRPRDETGAPKDLITEDMIDRLPSVKQALGTVANGIYQAFSTRQQELCRRLLLELIVLDETFEEPLRRRRRESELAEVLEQHFPDTSGDARHVIDAFVDAGLVRRFGAGADSRLEVAHEALLRHWQEFSAILDVQDVKERLNLVKQVGREAAEWMARGRSESYLNLKGERLDRARRHAEEGWLAEFESAAYVEACHNAAIKSQKLKTGIVVGGLCLVLVVVGLIGWSWLKSIDLDAQREVLAAQRDMLAAQHQALMANKAVLEANDQKIAAHRKMVAANLTAYTSFASSLPPWDDLDVAYTLARELGPQFRLALARALERLEDTTLVGTDRSLSLLPNDDGSALLQFHRASPTEHTLRIFLLSTTHTVTDRPVTIDVARRLENLATVKVGPAMAGNGDRLALLVFKSDQTGSGFTVEIYRVPNAEVGAAPKPLRAQAIDDAVQVSGITFHASGRRAAFVMNLQQQSSMEPAGSRILDIGLDEEERATVTDTPSPPGRPPVSTVAFLGDDLVMGHVDGSVSCPGDRYVDTSGEEPETRSPIGQISSLPGGETLAAVSLDGIYEFDCAVGQRRLLESAAGVRSITLVHSARHGRRMPLLSFVDGHGHRCLGRNGADWAEQPCNAQRRVAHALPLPVTADGQPARQLTIEDSRVAAVQVHPIEALDTEHRMVEGLLSGGTTVRWRAPRPGSGARAPAADTRSPWSVGADGVIEADNEAGNITQAALSRDGGHLLWMEWERDGRARPEPRFRLRSSPVDDLDAVREQAIHYRPDAFAIGSDGTLAIASPWKPSSSDPSRSDPAALLVGGVTLDQFAREQQPISCLGFSPDGSRLLAATRDGRVAVWRRRAVADHHLWEPDDGNWTPPVFETASGGGVTAAPLQTVTACDIADDGEVLVGSAEGNVVHLPADASPQPRAPRLLTERIAFRLASRVKAVVFDEADGRRYALALGDWQNSNCSRPAMPGYALSVWDTSTLADDDSSSPVASNCFPNQPVLALAGLQEGDGTTLARVRLLTAFGIKQHECPGCAIDDETAEQMLERLLRMAEETKKATPLDPQTVYRRYGLRF